MSSEQRDPKLQPNLQKILESLPDHVLEVSGKGEILYFSGSTQTGFDVRGRYVMEFLLPEYQEIALAAIARVIETGQPTSFRNRGAGRKTDQGIREYLTRVSPLETGRGFPTVSFSATDVTEFKHIETELTESKRRLDYVLTSNGIGTWEYDPGSGGLFWDEQMYALYGVRREDFPRPQEVWEAATPPEEQRRTWNLSMNAMQARDELDIRSTARWPTGEIRYLRGKGRMVVSGDLPARFVGVCWDVTHETRLQQELDRQKLKGIQTSKMATLGEMAGGIAHEINNPLTIIQGYGLHLKELAQANAPVSREFLASCADKITQTTERIASIIRGLKSFARESSNDPFARVAVSKVIGDTLALCRSRLASREIRTEVEIPEDVEIDCRAVAVSQALLNLIGNAADAIDEKDPDAETDARWIRIEVGKLAEGKVRLSVTDPGRGVPREIAEKILEPFFTTKPQGEGMGLGLSISAGLIEAHRGRLYLDASCPNTRFVIELPIRQPAPAKGD